MRKKTALLLALLIAAAAMPTVLTAAAGDSMIQGDLDQGMYFLRIQLQPGDPGFWQADEPAGDTAAVKLDGVEETAETMTVRYAPVSDGEITVALRHFTGIVCDVKHTFDLKVESGKITEVTGGSYTASPSDDELAGVVSGSWQETDTQFTKMTVSKNSESGWDVEIISPMTHGAYIFRATMYYDCEADAFLYADGTLSDLSPDGSGAGAVRASQVTGTVSFAGESKDDLRLVWYNDQQPDETIMFSRIGQ